LTHHSINVNNMMCQLSSPLLQCARYVWHKSQYTVTDKNLCMFLTVMSWACVTCYTRIVACSPAFQRLMQCTTATNIVTGKLQQTPFTDY